MSSAFVLLIECHARRAFDGGVEVLRLMSGGVRADYFDQQWVPAVLERPVMGARLGFDGRRFNAPVTSTVGGFSFSRQFAGLDNAADLIWKGARIIIRQGLVDDGEAGLGVIWDGRASGSSARDGAVVVDLADPADDMNIPLVDQRFQGTGGLEGGEDVEGRLKPRAWGLCENIPAILIDAPNNIWMLVDGPSVIHTVKDGGSPYIPGPVVGSLSALQDLSVPSGEVGLCPAFSLVKPWRVPKFTLTADISAGNVGTASEIADAMLGARTTLSFAPGEVLNYKAVQAASISSYVADERTIAQEFDRIFGGLGSFWRFNAQGEIELGQVGFAAPVQSFDQGVVSINRMRSITPTHQRVLTYRPNYRALSDGEIAQKIEAGDIEDLGPGAYASSLFDLDPDQAMHLASIEAGATVGATQDQVNDINQALSDAANAQATADGKIESFYQTTAPGAHSLGDFWIDTDDGNKLYRSNGSAWVEVQDAGISQAITDAAGAQATADGKVTTFVGESAPTAEGVGDLWQKPSTRQLYRWNGSTWGAITAAGVQDGATAGARAGINLYQEDGVTPLTTTQISNQYVSSHALTGNNLFRNGGFDLVGPDGRPAGIAGQINSGTNDNSAVTWEGGIPSTSLMLKKDGVERIRGFTPAWRVNPKNTYRCTVICRTEMSNASSGLYFRQMEYDSDLPANKQFLKAVEDSEGVVWTREINSGGGVSIENGPITTAATTFTISRKPTSTAKWMSVQVINWTGIGTQGLIVDAILIEELTPEDLAELDSTRAGKLDGVEAGADVTRFGLFIIDNEGKPAGIQPVESTTDRSQLQFGGVGVQILGQPDPDLGYGFPAIPIDDTATYTLNVRHKSSASSAQGLYIRFNEFNAQLPSHLTHIGHIISSAQQRTSFKDVVTNGPMPGTALVEDVYTYQPTPGAKFATLSFYNASAFTGTYELESVRLTRQGSSVNLLSQSITDALTLVNGPAEAGAQVNGAGTLALLINSSIGGVFNSGEASLVGIKDGAPALSTDGFINWYGTKITIERDQVSGYTILTHFSNQNGFIVFDTSKSQPFTVSNVSTNAAFVRKSGTQWQYDNNIGSWVNFTPSSAIAALGWLQTGASDQIVAGGLFGQPVPLELATFPSADVTGNNIASGFAGQGALATRSDVEWASHVRGVPSGQVFNNLLDTGLWKIGTSGSQGGFSRNGGNNENSIVLGSGPSGTTEVLWRAYSVGGSGDGGWNVDVTPEDFDDKRCYRSVVWAMQTSADGTIYHGCDGSYTYYLGGGANTNPYFWAGDLPQLNKWYLLVGIIHGSDYTGANTNMSGVYDPETGARIYAATEYRNSPGAPRQRQRVYQYYTSSDGRVAYFARPRFEELNGNEPSLMSLMRENALLNTRLSLTSDGRFMNGGTQQGSVSITGLGYTGALNATYGASWSSNVSGRPTELVDGRIAAALSSTGRLYDSRNSTQSLVGGVSNTITTTAYFYVTTSRIDVSSHTRQYDFGGRTYNAGSISGLSSYTYYYVYADDPNFTGGTVTYRVSSTLAGACGVGRIYLGRVRTASSSSGGGSLPPEDCVCVDMFVADGKRAGDLSVGDALDLMDDNMRDMGRGGVTAYRQGHQPCVELVTKSASVIVSTTAPVVTREKGTLKAPDVKGLTVAVLIDGVYGFERVLDVRDKGARPIARISVGGISYAAGVEPNRMIFTHNAMLKQ